MMNAMSRQARMIAIDLLFFFQMRLIKQIKVDSFPSLLRFYLYAWLIAHGLFLFVAYPAATLWPESIKNLPISSRIFQDPVIHVVKQYANDPTVIQKDRTESLDKLVDAAFSAYHAVGLKAFIDSGTLLGYMRNGQTIPWDEDADVGFDLDECKALFPNAGDFQRAMEENLDPTRFLMLGADCQGTSAIKLGHLVFSGKIVDITTGFYVDQFAYKLHKKGPHAGKYRRTQLARNQDYDALIVQPLKKVTFLGNPHVYVPNDPVAFLNVQFQNNLAVPTEWYGIYHVRASVFAWVAVGIFALLSLDWIFASIAVLIYFGLGSALQLHFLIQATAICSIGVSAKRTVLIGGIILCLLLFDYSGMILRNGFQVPVFNWRGNFFYLF